MNSTAQNIVLDYSPFGMTQPGRSFNKNSYRFNFQGQETEQELWGGEASFFKYRISDNRLGRFFSVDPLSASFPWNSPYAFSENRVIDAVELEGAESDIITKMIVWYVQLKSKSSKLAQDVINHTANPTYSTSSVPTDEGMSGFTEQMINSSVIANDAVELGKAVHDVRVDVQLEIGDQLDNGGQAIEDVGALGIPFTSGGSAAFIPIGTTISGIGKIIKGGTHVSEGNYSEAYEEGKSLTYDLVGNSVTSAAMKASKKSGLLNNAEGVVDKGIKATQEGVYHALDRTVEETFNKVNSSTELNSKGLNVVNDKKTKD